MGAWQVSELETDDRAGTLTIEATGAKMTGPIQTPRDASYDQATLGQLAAAIAERHNLPLAISAALKAEALGHIDQRAESDLALANHHHAGDYIIQTATHQIRPNQPYTTSLTATTKPAKA